MIGYKIKQRKGKKKRAKIWLCGLSSVSIYLSIDLYPFIYFQSLFGDESVEQALHLTFGMSASKSVAAVHLSAIELSEAT